LQDPASIRIAAFAIITATITAVVAGGILMRLLDHKEYPNLGRALWFTLQTVTTVGYGDDTPTRVAGRVIASVVMLTGIGFITIVTAAVTSAFVQASQQGAVKAANSLEAQAANVETDLAAVDARLNQMEQTLALLVEQTRPR
jgi:voltage-gated potassium channel